MTVRAGTAYRRLFHAAGKFCENQLKACSLRASIRHVYRHLFVSKKAAVDNNIAQLPLGKQSTCRELVNIKLKYATSLQILKKKKKINFCQNSHSTVYRLHYFRTRAFYPIAWLADRIFQTCHSDADATLIDSGCLSPAFSNRAHYRDRVVILCFTRSHHFRGLRLCAAAAPASANERGQARSR